MSEAADALTRARASRIGAFWELAPRRPGELTGPLAGAAVAVKDCFDVSGLRTTCGVAREWPAAGADSEAVRRLLRAGAAPLGKTAMDQLAWSTYGYAPGFPACLNPLNAGLTPGGSSCGSAAAVAAGLARIGLGTDDAGSIRIPAACCGLLGLKPPSGWVPLAGATAFSPSFDCGGTIAGSLDDCLAAIEALAGWPLPSSPPRRVKVALLEDLLEEAEPVVANAVEEAARTLVAAGAELQTRRLVSLPPPGMGKVLAIELDTTWGERVRSEPELYGHEVRGSIAYAERLTDADRERAREQLAAARRAIERSLDGCTAALTPTLLWPAPAAAKPPSVAEMTRCTRPFNVLDWAALSLPADTVGPPIGIQLAAPGDRIGELVGLARALVG